MIRVDKYIKLIYIFAVLFLTAHISRIFVETGMMNWYEFSYKPSITPVNEVFPIVWTIMYLLIGAALFFAIYDSPMEEVHKYNNEFLLQMVLQCLWCYTFFTKGELLWGFVVIVVMVLTAFRMIRIYTDAGRLSGGLLYPYLIWLLYATYLNLNFVIELGVSAPLQ